MKNKFDKKNIGIILLMVIVLGVGYLINYAFFEPTPINAFIASKFYETPANNYFDDENFYKCVVDEYNRVNKTSLAYTTNLSDEQLQTITRLSCQNKNILSVKGVEKLSLLKEFYVSNNQLTNLDVSNNTALTNLSVYNNQLTNLDVSKNAYLKELNVRFNQIISLDVSKNKELTSLDVSSNQLTSLDVSYNEKLTSLEVTNYTNYKNKNQITGLDVSKNTALVSLDVTNNQLTSLDVSNNIALTSLKVGNNNISVGGFPFESLVVGNNQITSLDVSKNANLKELDVSSNQLTSLDVSNNIALTSLSVNNNQLTNLDVSNNIALTSLYVNNNQLTSLNLSKNTALRSLSISGVTSLDLSNNMALTSFTSYDAQLKELNVSGTTALTYLYVNNGQLAKLNVSGATALTDLIVYGNQLKELNVSGATSLRKLSANNNKLTSLDVSGTLALEDLSIGGNELTNLDVSNNKILTSLYVSNNQLKNFDVSKNTVLTSLSVSDNQLTNLDVSNNTALTNLNAYNNQLSSLDVSNNTALTNLSVYNNQLSSLDVSNNTALTNLSVYNNQLTSLDVSGATKLTSLSAYKNQLTSLDLSKNTELTSLSVYNNQLTSLDVSGATKLTNLSAYYNQLTSLSVSGATKLTNLSAYYNQLTSLDLSKNTELTSLDIGYNQLTELDLSNNIALKYLTLSSNPLGSLSVTNNTSLLSLNAYNSQLTSLSVGNNTVLTELMVSGNQLSSLDVSGATALTKLSANCSQLTSLDVSKNLALTILEVSGFACLNNNLLPNQLTSLDVSNNTALTRLDVSSNRLTSLNVSNNTKLIRLDVSDNQLTSLDVSKNTVLTNLDVWHNSFYEKKYIFKNDKVEIGNNVKIPSRLNWNSPSWTSNDTNIVTVDGNVVTGISEGNVDINGNLSGKYTNTSNITVIDITSDKYKIDANNGYIYVGSDKDADTIKSNINISSDDVDMDVDLKDYKLKISHDGVVFKEFDIVVVYSKVYDLSNEYFYVGTDSFNHEGLDLINCTSVVEDGNLLIKYKDVILDTYKIVGISSEIYGLSDEYIYLGFNKFDDSKLKLINCTSVVEDNKLYIKYDDSILDEFILISISSKEYDLSNDYIYLDINEFDKNKVNLINCTSVVEDTKLLIKYGDTVLDEYKLVSISSDVYDLVKDYIYLSISKFDKSKVSLINCTSIVDGNKLYIKYNDVVLKEFLLINISSEVYDLNNDYIYLGLSEFDKNKVNLINCISIVEDNKLLIKYGDTILDEYKLVSISSSKYDLNKDYIYVGVNKIDSVSITIINGKQEIKDNKLLVKYGSIVLDEYKLVSISSEVYDLSKEYIYLGYNKFDNSKVNLINCISMIEDNKLLIKYGDTILDEYKLVSISSEVYDLSKDYIYLGTGSIDTSNIFVINCSIGLVDDKLVVNYGDVVLGEYKLINFKFNNYRVIDKEIIVLDGISYDNFIDDIVGSNGLSYKLFNGEDEVVNGNVLVDMKLKVYYNDVMVDEYLITNKYLVFDESLEIDDEKTIINKIKAGTSINDIYNKIDTSGEVSVFDKEDKIIDSYDKYIGTGNKFKIVLGSQALYYMVSVRGDLNGNGLVEVNDLVQVSKHMVKHTSLTDVEFNASDINNDIKVDINDIIKIAKHIVKKTEL